MKVRGAEIQTVPEKLVKVIENFTATEPKDTPEAQDITLVIIITSEKQADRSRMNAGGQIDSCGTYGTYIQNRRGT